MRSARQPLPTPTSITVIPVSMQPSLALLLKAHDLARECRCEDWQFALEAQSLQAQGSTPSHLRWLAAHGLVEYGTETTTSGARKRSFRKSKSLAFTEKTCFVLTPQGVAIARQAAPLTQASGVAANLNEKAGMRSKVPHWDREQRELRWGDLVVKRFYRPAPNQEAILDAFEEDGWPPYIDDPIPGKVDMNSRERLHDAVKNLNRHQINRLIHFQGDGSGRRVRWSQVQ